MRPIDKKLFETYCETILEDAHSFDSAELKAWLDTLPMDRRTRILLHDAFFDRYIQWSADAFAVGLHLGLSLLHDDVRHNRAQQV